MYPRRFEYHDPTSVEEVLQVLQRHGEEAKLMAGGMSLLPMMKLRLASPARIIDLWRVPGLEDIRAENGSVVLGAKATHDAIERSELLRARCPLLPEAAGVIGDAQIRNLGTMGGSVAHADPAADYPPALIALGASITVRCAARGARTLPAADFFTDLFTTALRADEMVTEVRVPALAPRTGWAYLKLSRRASDFAIVGAAALLRLGEDGTCQEARVVLGGLAPTPVRARQVEEALRGQPLDGARLRAAARSAAEGVTPFEDVQADATYRAEVAQVYARRALERALARANRAEAAP